MVTSCLNNNSLQFRCVDKDRLFYDQFQYAVNFYIEEANCLRDLSHDNIDYKLQRLSMWREIAQKRMGHLFASYPSARRSLNKITPEVRANLHVVATVLLDTSAIYKLVVSVNSGTVYTNDLDLLAQLDQVPCLQHKSYSEARVVRQKDTVRLRASPHRYRSYFRTQQLTPQQKEHLENFLQNQQQLIRIGPALQRWLDLPFNRTQDYFFVDYQKSSWASMLNLVVPGLIRKTMPIIVGK